MQMITLIFAPGDSPLHIVIPLKNTLKKLFEWFTNNEMKVNHDKCHLLMSALTPISIKVKDYVIKIMKSFSNVIVDANRKFKCQLEKIL